MTTQFSAEFKDDELREFLDQLNNNLKQINKNNLKTIVARFGTVVFADIIKHFENAQGSNGPWEKWSDLYTSRQRQLGKSWPSNALQFSGRLRNTFKPTNYRNTSDGLLWYNNAKTSEGFPYAAHHDETALVTRSFMWLSRDAFDKLMEITLDALLEENWS